MPIVLSCTSCQKPLKVKDELARRKIKCPGCGTVIAVPRPVVEIVAEAPPAPIAEESPLEDWEEVPPTPKKKKKGVLSTDMNEVNAAITNFDLRRFKPLGWVLFIVCLGSGILCWVLVDLYYPASWASHNPATGLEQRAVVVYAGAAFLGGMVPFFLVMGLLYLLGIHIIKPKDE